MKGLQRVYSLNCLLQVGKLSPREGKRLRATGRVCTWPSSGSAQITCFLLSSDSGPR